MSSRGANVKNKNDISKASASNKVASNELSKEVLEEIERIKQLRRKKTQMLEGKS